MSTNTCPHFNASAQKCDLLVKLQNQGHNLLQMYTMMGAMPDKADWRGAFCTTAKWTECAVYSNEQRGDHR